MAIQSFADPAVEEFFTEGGLRKDVSWAPLAQVVARKLDMLHYAGALLDLASSPGDRLEPLKGFHSIRVNDQWRVVFRWTEPGPAQVDIRDHH